MESPIVIVCTDPARADEADRLADDLALPRADTVPPQPGQLALVVTPERLELRPGGTGGPGAVSVDFAAGGLARRGREAGVRREAVARAAGLGGGWRPAVIDATAGLGRDSFVLAALGCTVHACERHPVVAALFADGLARARRDPATRAAAERVTLTTGDAAECLAASRTDVALVDPMHPPRTKSAAVKKEMRLFQQLVGDDSDAPALLGAAIASARRRVVVKRPLRGEALAGPSPVGAVRGRAVRFDIYTGQAGDAKR